MSAPDPLITRLESLGPDEWRPEPPPELVLPPQARTAPRRTLTLRPLPAFAVALLLLAVGAGGALIAGSRDQPERASGLHGTEH